MKLKDMGFLSPFQYAVEHFSLLGSTLSFATKLKHLLWGFFEFIPIINYLIVWLDPTEFKANPTSPIAVLQAKSNANTSPISNTSDQAQPVVQILLPEIQSVAPESEPVIAKMDLEKAVDLTSNNAQKPDTKIPEKSATSFVIEAPAIQATPVVKQTPIKPATLVAKQTPKPAAPVAKQTPLKPAAPVAKQTPLKPAVPVAKQTPVKPVVPVAKQTPKPAAPVAKQTPKPAAKLPAVKPITSAAQQIPAQQAATEEQVTIPKTSVKIDIHFPHDEVVSLPNQPDPQAPLKDKAAYSHALFRNKLYQNTFFNINALRKQNAGYQSYFEFCKARSIDEFPLVNAVYANDLKQVETIITSPLYIGINNEYFHVQPQAGEGFDFYDKQTLLQYAIASDNTALFDLIITKGLCVEINRKALLTAIQSGTKGEYYLAKLLDKNSAPPDDELIKEAIKNKISPALMERLKGRQQLHENDRNKQNALERACVALDYFEIRRLVEDEHFCLDHVIRLVTYERQNGSRYHDQQQIIAFLLTHGAVCDGQSLDQVFQWDHPLWEETALMMIEKGANPFDFDKQAILTLLNRVELSHPLIQKIEMLYPSAIQHHLNTLNLATLWEIDFTENQVRYNGQNINRNTYALMNESLNALYEPEFSDLSNAPVYDTLLELSMQYADELLTRKQFNGIADELFEQSQQFPVVIPTSANGHASVIILWKNYIIQANQGAAHLNIAGLSRNNPGIDVYHYDRRTLTDQKIFMTLDNSNIPDKDKTNDVNRGIMIDNFAYNLDRHRVKVHHLDTTGQRIGNCTWTSSAMLGFQVAMELLHAGDSISQMTFSNEGNQFIEDLTTVAKILSARQYLANVQSHPQDMRESLDTQGISAVCRACLFELVEGKAKHPAWYEQLIVEIMASGLDIDCKSNTLYRYVDSRLASEQIIGKTQEVVNKIQQKIISLLGAKDITEAENILYEPDAKTWQLK